MASGQGGEAYAGYLGRFAQAHGDHAVGDFVKHAGRLVKKLGADEFAALHDEFEDVARHHHECLERGDTINDVAVKMLRELATTLLLASPV